LTSRIRLIPAIDIQDGKCVRLRQGKKSDVSVFSEDPEAVADSWAAQGCERLHLVDLDGAFEGAPVNHALIARISTAHRDIAVQVGGGIRSHAHIDALLEAGASQVVLGTKAIEDRKFLSAACDHAPGKCFLGLDTRDGKVAVRGWTLDLDMDYLDFAREVQSLDLAGFVHTDISRDGMMMGLADGPQASLKLAEVSGKPVIVSGGVTTLGDLTRIRQLAFDASDAVLGVISGRALYEKRFDFAAGQRALDGLPSQA